MINLLQTWVLLSLATSLIGSIMMPVLTLDKDLETAQKRLYWFFLLVDLWLGSDIIIVFFVTDTLSTLPSLMIGILYIVISITGILLLKPQKSLKNTQHHD